MSVGDGIARVYGLDKVQMGEMVEFANGTRCPPPDQAPCLEAPEACAECTTCFQPGQLPGGMPDTEQFQVGGTGGWEGKAGES